MQHPQLLIPKQKGKSSSSKLSIITILSIGFLLFIGAFITFAMFQKASSTIRTVPQSKIGGSESLHQGPWPECLNMLSSDCIKHIAVYAEDLRKSQNFQIVQQDMMVTMDFSPNRVRIYVNDSDIVIQIPRRG